MKLNSKISIFVFNTNESAINYEHEKPIQH